MKDQLPAGFLSPGVRRFTLMLKLHGFDYENRNSLQSVTAERAAKLSMAIAHQERLIDGLPMLFSTRLHQRKYRKKYDWMNAKYRHRLRVLNLLMKSYDELISN